jgi:hypothetical protein
MDQLFRRWHQRPRAIGSEKAKATTSSRKYPHLYDTRKRSCDGYPPPPPSPVAVSGLLQWIELQRAELRFMPRIQVNQLGDSLVSATISAPLGALADTGRPSVAAAVRENLEACGVRVRANTPTVLVSEPVKLPPPAPSLPPTGVFNDKTSTSAPLASFNSVMAACPLWLKARCFTLRMPPPDRRHPGHFLLLWLTGPSEALLPRAPVEFALHVTRMCSGMPIVAAVVVPRSEIDAYCCLLSPSHGGIDAYGEEGLRADASAACRDAPLGSEAPSDAAALAASSGAAGNTVVGTSGALLGVHPATSPAWGAQLLGAMRAWAAAVILIPADTVGDAARGLSALANGELLNNGVCAPLSAHALIVADSFSAKDMAIADIVTANVTHAPTIVVNEYAIVPPRLVRSQLQHAQQKSPGPEVDSQTPEMRMALSALPNEAARASFATFHRAQRLAGGGMLQAVRRPPPGVISAQPHAAALPSLLRTAAWAIDLRWHGGSCLLFKSSTTSWDASSTIVSETGQKKEQDASSLQSVLSTSTGATVTGAAGLVEDWARFCAFSRYQAASKAAAAAAKVTSPSHVATGAFLDASLNSSWIDAAAWPRVSRGAGIFVTQGDSGVALPSPAPLSAVLAGSSGFSSWDNAVHAACSAAAEAPPRGAALWIPTLMTAAIGLVDRVAPEQLPAVGNGASGADKALLALQDKALALVLAFIRQDRMSRLTDADVVTLAAAAIEPAALSPVGALQDSR